jgi:kynurenine 3-monooxygenase
MALDNFVEMRDKVASPVFRWKKKLEHLLQDLFPGTLVPRYNLVSFSTVPYSEALRKGARIDRVLRWLAICGVVMAATALVALRVPWWFVIIALVVAGGVMWDRWRSREETRV